MVDRSELINDPEVMLRQAMQGHQAKVWTTFPGIVQKVDNTKYTCVVQPAIQAEIQDEENNSSFVNLPLLLDCPIQFLACGTFLITLPLAAGDEVLVHIASRCIDSWWQNSGIQPPAEFRMHDLSDGFVSPGVYSLPNAPSSFSTANLEIRKVDGSAKIAITPTGEIDLVGTLIKLTGNVLVSGTLTNAAGIELAAHKHAGVTAGTATSGPAIP